MKTAAASVVALLVLVSATLTYSANAQVNGDFNTGDLTGWWTYTPDSPSQSITVLPADAFSYDGTPYAHTMDYGGSVAAVMGQEVSLSEGSQYNISLVYRSTQWGGGGVGTFYWDSSWNQVGWEWTSLYTGDGTDTGWQSFTSPTWTAPAGTAHISVRLDAWTWSDTYYDNVSVNIIPEPGSAALVGLGIVGLLFCRRRRV